MAGNITLFTNASGAAAGPIDFVKDVFDDVSLPASNNTSLTSNANTNPFGYYFANDDAPKFQAKTLYIKDLILMSDRSKWISNKPTYQVIWSEPCPSVIGYFYGNIQICANQAQVAADSTTFEADTNAVTIKAIGDGFGVNGVIRRAAFLVNDMRAATGTAQVVTDGVNGSTIDFSNLATNSDDTSITRYSAQVHAASNETNDLHDIRIKANEAGTLKVVGVIVYFENASATPYVAPGSTYVDKSKITTTVGASFTAPTFGSSLGGNALIYKTASNGYAMASLSASTCISAAQGSSGTNLLTVTTGHGASFPQGSGVVIPQGTSMYVGSVVNVSTDTLTVSPTLSFGISNIIYRAWLSNPTFPISATLMELATSIDFGKFIKNAQGVTGIFDLTKNYAFWSKNTGATYVDGESALNFLGASGFIQVDGSFSAAEVEMVGNAIFHATLSVNGTPGWGQNTGQTGPIRRTVFSDAGPGWNSFVFAPGASFGAIGIQRINLYRWAKNSGITFGALGHFNANQAYTERTAINATLMSLGTAKRLYADQLFLAGSWVRGATHVVPGGALYYGASTNSILKVQYYGTNFALVGTVGGGTLSIDGVGTALTFNAMKSVATLGFHTVSYTVGSGATAQIHAFDFTAPYGEMTNDQLVAADAPVTDDTPVMAVYTVAADLSSAFVDNSTYLLNYNQRIIDTHHTVRTGVGVWNCQVPRKGIYDISAGWVDSLAGGTVYNIQVSLIVNGVTIFTEVRSGTMGSTVTTGGIAGVWSYPLNQGDVVTIQAFGKADGGSAHSIDSNSGRNCVFRLVERKRL